MVQSVTCSLCKGKNPNLICRNTLKADKVAFVKVVIVPAVRWEAEIGRSP